MVCNEPGYNNDVFTKLLVLLHPAIHITIYVPLDTNKLAPENFDRWSKIVILKPNLDVCKRILPNQYLVVFFKGKRAINFIIDSLSS